MIHRVLRIGKWVIDFLFAVKDYDLDGVLACAYDCGANRDVLEEIRDSVEFCDYNCAFTYTNPRRHRGLVAIGPTTSGDEFIDSFVHEIQHLADSIAENSNKETPAYIAGDSARELASVVCRLGCGCRK